MVDALLHSAVWSIAAIKALLFLFVGVGFVGYWTWRKPLFFVSLVAIAGSVSYFLFVFGAPLLFWGSTGDELFVGSFLERVASGGFFQDFSYGALPPFYPPLYFWAVGFLGWMFEWDGVASAQFGVFLTMLFVPFALYASQRLFWKKRGSVNDLVFALVSVVLVMTTLEWDTVILKPYELLSAIGVALWIAFFAHDFFEQTLTRRKMFLYGLFGGLLFLVYYFWFFIVLLAFGLLGCFVPRGSEWRYYRTVIVVGLVTLGIASPYWFPLALTYASFGAENWQHIFFVPEDLHSFFPFFRFSWIGVVSLAGLVSMIVYVHRPFVRGLTSIFVGTYLWQAMSIGALLFFDAPFQAAKGFHFLAMTALVLAAAYGCAIAWERVSVYQGKMATPLFIVSWLLLAWTSFGGAFFDDPVVREQWAAMRTPRKEMIDLAAFLPVLPDFSQAVFLSSGLPQLSTMVPMNLFINHNIHTSHPAARFSDRFSWLRDTALLRDARSVSEYLKITPFGPIHYLLLYRDRAHQQYVFYFWVDDYPQGGREETMMMDERLIQEPYFTRLTTTGDFSVWRVD